MIKWYYNICDILVQLEVALFLNTIKITFYLLLG